MSEETKRTRQAYIWTREFPKERLQKIQQVQHAWESLFGEPGDRGHYARFQWLGLDDVHLGNGIREKLVAPLDGRGCEIDLILRTTRTWFAREVYGRALANTRNRYPDFDAHHFLEGPRAGERILEFLSEEHDLARGYLWTALWKIIEDEHPTVSETCVVEACSTWGYPMAVAASKRWGHELARDRRRITVVLNRREITDQDYLVIRAQLEAGKLPDLNPAPVGFSFDDIREGVIELSAPELVILNWHDARGDFSEADRELHEAAYQLDRSRIERAVAGGANLNQVDESGKSAISNLIEGWGDHLGHCQAPESELKWYGGSRPEREIPVAEVCSMVQFLLEHGAHPDVHGPEETSAIVDAALGRHAAIVELLLKHGANAAIDWAWDSSFGEWPQAWDSPCYHAFQEHCPEARRVYDLLILNRPSPCFSKAGEEEDRAAALGGAPAQTGEGLGHGTVLDS